MICVAIYDDLKTTGIKKDILKEYRKHVQPALITNHQMFCVGKPVAMCPAVTLTDNEADTVTVELTVLDNPKKVLKILHEEMMHRPDNKNSVTEFIKIGTTVFEDLDLKGVPKKQNVYIYRWLRDTDQWDKVAGGEWKRDGKKK